MRTSCPALLIAAPASGQGKTTVTAALARYHARMGRTVRVFKVGADFIDPMILEAASGHPVDPLDLWLVGTTECKARLYAAAQTADLILIEGVMGLFDGSPSAADLAQVFGVPVLAVIDAAAMAQTFGAIAFGLAHYRPALPFAGVLANRVASTGHGDLLRASLPASIPWHGMFCHQTGAELPERHLGLVQAAEIDDLDRCLDTLAAAIAETTLTELPPPVSFQSCSAHSPPRLLEGIRIGIARDRAFSFLYPANVDVLRAMGAELFFFSPLADTSLPPVDSLYLPGGYPELHLPALAGNTALKQALRDHVAADKPLLAECGGMLYLLDELEDQTGQVGTLCEIMPGRAQMQKCLVGLGMQSAVFDGAALRAHTFHHSRLETRLQPTRQAHCVSGSPGEAIYQINRLTASYLHWYLPSSPTATARLLHP